MFIKYGLFESQQINRVEKMLTFFCAAGEYLIFFMTIVTFIK